MSTAVLVAYIDEHRERFGVAPICQVLTHAGTKIAPSTCYATKTRPASARAVTDAATSEVIRSVHAANYGVYGVRKCTPSCAGRVIGWPAARSTAG